MNALSGVRHDAPPAGARAGQRRAKADRAHAYLREAIIRLDLLPGAPINTEEVGRRLGVSRQPVSEALARLAGEGLVDIEPQKGTYVARIRLAAVAEGAFLRKAIEVACMREIASRADDVLIGALERNLRYQKAALDAGDTNGFYELDVAFHSALLDRLGFARTTAVVEASRAQLERVRRLVLPRQSRVAAAFAEHVAIKEALAARNATAAAGEMRRHLEAAMQEVNAFAKAEPALFE